MFDDQKFGNLFQTRTGTPSGTANERKMLDTIGGAEGFRTRMQNAADGSVTMLRTRNGMPEFSTVGSQSTGRQTLWRGLAAYPEGFSDAGVYSWSLPVVFSAPDGYKIAARNPVQLASLSYLYWVGDKGNVCGSGGGKAYFTMESKNNQYTKYTVATIPQSLLNGNGDMPVAKYGPIPFVSTPSNLFSFATSNVLANISGAALFKLAPLTVNFDPTKGPTYAEQLPQVISKDGTDVVLLAKDEKYFTEPLTPYFTNEKCYWYLRLQMTGSSWSVSCDETLVKVAAAQYSKDAVGVVASWSQNSVTDTIEPMQWSYVVLTGYDYAAQLVCNWNTALKWYYGNVWEAYSCSQNGMTTSGEKSSFWHWPLDIKRTDTKVVGFVNGTSVLTPLVVTMSCDLHRLIDCEGQRYYGYRDETEAWEAIWPEDHNNPSRILLGDYQTDYTRSKVNVDETNNSFLSVNVGGATVKTFEISTSATGNAVHRLVYRQKRVEGHSYGLFMLDGDSYNKISSDFRLGRWSSGVPSETSQQIAPSPYFGQIMAKSGIILETEYEAFAANARDNWPGVWETFGYLNDTGPNNEDIATDYVTNLTLSAKSRFIVAFDAALAFHAYVEMEVTYAATCVATPAQKWMFDLRPLNVPQQQDPHTVTCTFVIHYQGVEHRKQLFKEVVSKPLNLPNNQTTNWYSWRHTVFDNPGMQLVSNEVYLPTPSTFKGIDGVFQHQGVCPDFAGFTTEEIGNPPWHGYTGDIKRLIYAKRFKITDDKMHWLLSYLKIDECKRGAGDQSPPGDLLPYYYCPELKKKLDETYQIEFDQNGFVDWIDNIPDPSATPPNRDASCWRI